MKRHAFSITIAGLLLLSLGIFGGFSTFAKSQAENSIETYQTDSQNVLFRNYIFSEETVKAVCEKFNLDYNTVTVDEVFEDRERLDYTTSASLRLDNGDRPLLESNPEQIHDSSVSSLEFYLNETYAFDGGHQIIEAAYEKYQISAETGKIQDFTIEQLMDIERQAYETSPHPH